MGDSGLHLALEEGEKGIGLIFHESALDALEGSLESLLLDLLLSSGIIDGLLDLLEGAECDLSEVVPEVLALEVLHHLEHVEGPVVEVLLNVQLLVGEEVNERSLLDEVVLSIESEVLHLLLGVSEMSKLLLLSHVGPHAAQLLGLVAGVHVVEHGELGSEEISEMSHLDVTEVEGN